MKKIIFILLSFVLSLLQAQEKHQFTHKVGDLIKLDFTGSNLISKDAEGITCEIFIDRADLEPLLVETPMTRSDAGWSCSFNLTDPKSRFIVYRFASDDLKDDNNGDPNTIIVFTKDGKPVDGAHLSAGNFYLTGRLWDMKRKSDLEMARNEFELEKKNYPRSWQAALGIIEIEIKKILLMAINRKLIKNWTNYTKPIRIMKMPLAVS